MVIENEDSRALEPDLVCSKDGEVLERSERETVRVFNEIVSFTLPRFLAAFVANRRF